jgi:hypothetical protein
MPGTPQKRPFHAPGFLHAQTFAPKQTASLAHGVVQSAAGGHGDYRQSDPSRTPASQLSHAKCTRKRTKKDNREAILRKVGAVMLEPLKSAKGQGGSTSSFCGMTQAAQRPASLANRRASTATASQPDRVRISHPIGQAAAHTWEGPMAVHFRAILQLLGDEGRNAHLGKCQLRGRRDLIIHENGRCVALVVALQTHPRAG